MEKSDTAGERDDFMQKKRAEKGLKIKTFFYLSIRNIFRGYQKHT